MVQDNKQNAGVPRPVIDEAVCKSCARCVAACPKKVLIMADRLSVRGVSPAEYTGKGCTGCGICFYNCPEPYALSVEK